MSESVETTATSEPVVVPAEMPPAVEVQSVGETLRLAREARGASQAEVAQALRIGVRQVEAIETNRWDALPGTPFVRGFVRNYARWLGIDGEALVARIDLGGRENVPVLDLRSSTDATLPRAGDLPRRDFATLGLGIVVIAVAVAAYFLVPEDFWTLPGREPVSPAPSAVSEPSGTPVGVPMGAPGPTTVGESGAAALPVQAPPSNAATPASAGMGEVSTGASGTGVAASAGMSGEKAAEAPAEKLADAAVAVTALELTFETTSWAEVRDRQGTLVLSETVTEGEVRKFDGKGPFLVVIGRADGVKVRYKGKAVDLAPHTRKNIARVTLE